jgi:methionine-rich copper-binding protein CopC
MLLATVNLEQPRRPLKARPRRRLRDRVMARMSIEPLEVRWLPSGWPLVVAPNETIDKAQDLGTLSQRVETLGSIGNGPAGAADVTWYHFSLTESARVDLALGSPAGGEPFASVLSLYNSDPQDYSDPYDLDGHRLLAQIEANPSDGAALYTQDLGPGDYFLAISGAGNLDFSPVIAGSGLGGTTGSYELTIDSTDLGLAGAGPTVLSSDPANGQVLDSSPLAIRLEMSGPLDAGTILPGQTVQLFSGTIGMLGDRTGSQVALASVNFSSAADELQLFPLAPLAPGNYVVWLAGDSRTDQAVLTDASGVPFGEDAAHPAGADLALSFQVDGIDGVVGATGSDDTASTARDLGDLTDAGLIQKSGAIGDDPAFNPSLSPDASNPEPQLIPANQVDLYHFRISGPGRYAMLSEVFAGRIGSPLDPGLSLYELDPSDGSLAFMAGNNNTLNPTPGTDGSIPLFTDPALAVGLTAGDYYLAVAGGSNTPSPLEGQVAGSLGLFDPNVPDSAQSGWSTGQYVLNLLVEPTPAPPTVLASSPSSGQVLDEAPTELTVDFSGPINIQQLAYEAFESRAQATLTQVFVVGPDGTKYYPRFASYNRATNGATFLMLDGLANGSYDLHLSGTGGLTDLGGNPIAGNDASGDFVIPFQVMGPERAIAGDTTDGYTVASRAEQGVSQDLGVLFPRELQAGVTVIRGPDSGTTEWPATTEDDYVIQLLQSQNYSFTLSGDSLPGGAAVTVRDASGQSIPLLASDDGLVYFAPLVAETYTVAVGGWSSDESATASYRLTVDLVGQQDNAPPLLDGPAPALQIHLVGTTSTTAPGLGPLPMPTPMGSSGDGPSGPSSVSPAGRVDLGPPQSEAAVAFASLGMSPLGGVASEAGQAAAAPVQVALGLAPSLVFSSVLSLVTLTQVIALNREGEAIEVMNTLEQSLAESSGGTAMMIQPEVTGQLMPLVVTAQLEPLLIDPAPVGADIEPAVLEAAVLPGLKPATVSFSRGPAIVNWAETETVAQPNWVTRVLIAGAALATAFRVRRAIQNGQWKKQARPEQARSAGTICPQDSHGGSTAAWPPHVIRHALPHECRRPLQHARSFRSSHVR